MSESVQISERLEAYRAAALELHEFSIEVERKLEEAGETGDLDRAKEALAKLSFRTKEFEDLRSTLSPLDLFIAKYGVMKINEHAVSFVLPKGVSRIEVLKEAQVVLSELLESDPESYKVANYVWPATLSEWERKKDFTEPALESLLLRIDGNVEGSHSMSRDEHEKKGWNNVALQDLAVAHAIFYLLTSDSLFQGNVVRAAGGTFLFNSNGLDVLNFYDDNRHNLVSASRSLFAPNSKI